METRDTLPPPAIALPTPLYADDFARIIQWAVHMNGHDDSPGLRWLETYATWLMIGELGEINDVPRERPTPERRAARYQEPPPDIHPSPELDSIMARLRGER